MALKIQCHFCGKQKDFERLFSGKVELRNKVKGISAITTPRICCNCVLRLFKKTKSSGIKELSFRDNSSIAERLDGSKAINIMMMTIYRVAEETRITGKRYLSTKLCLDIAKSLAFRFISLKERHIDKYIRRYICKNDSELYIEKYHTQKIGKRQFVYNKDDPLYKKALQNIEARKHSISDNVEYRKSGFVYLIKYQRFYKIGFTKNKEQRIKFYKQTYPGKTKVIFCVRSKMAFSKESKIKRQYEKRVIKGTEWFDLTNEDVEDIKHMVLAK